MVLEMANYLGLPLWALLVLAQATVPPEVDGELKPGPTCLPTYAEWVCLRRSRPPIPGVKCPSPVCVDATTRVHADKLREQGLLERYPGSFVGTCPGFTLPTMPEGARTECGP